MALSHTMSISKILSDSCAIRQKIGVKKHFFKYCLQFFGGERVLVEHREVCLKTNGKQTAKLKSGSIIFI